MFVVCVVSSVVAVHFNLSCIDHIVSVCFCSAVAHKCVRVVRVLSSFLRGCRSSLCDFRL